MGATLRIEGEGATANSYHAFLDDQDISNFTHEIDLHMGVNDANVATIHVFVDKVELSADVQAKLVGGRVQERGSLASKIRRWFGS